MKNGICPKCKSIRVYFKDYELIEVRINGKQVQYTAYICTDCGYLEMYVTDTDALSKIAVRAEKLGDWKKAE